MEPTLMQEFEMMVYGDWFKVKTSLLGEFNQENILLAARSALSLGVKMETIVVALSKFEGVAGRFNIVKNSLGINIVIDFAHTEQGVGAVLKLVRENLLTNGNQLIIMLGSNGERDRTKRAPMAKKAVTWADKVIITNEDPRNEDPTQIYEDMVKGCVEKMEKVSRVDDRRGAIEKALRMAQKGDWVLLLGKGHERSMNIKGVEVRWNEFAEVRKLLLKLKQIQD
jgi:UDP-N-acetylmuramoyl-L-alanyl-D-glutamate--2,6-diaminopimelate ligase